MEAQLIPLDHLLEQGWTPEGWQKSLSGIPFDHEGGIRCRAVRAVGRRRALERCGRVADRALTA